MPTFKVDVTKLQRVTGVIEVEAKSARAALTKIRKRMDDPVNPLQTCDRDIIWGDPEYQDFTFEAPGDVRETT